MFVVVPRAGGLRSAVEETIQDLYWKRYGATLPGFAETIVAEIEDHGAVTCAAGLRFGDEKFLSECYLDQPIENVLRDRTAVPVHRGGLAEVCHLASVGPNRSLPFVRSVIELLAENQIDWAVFTATGPLRKVLSRSGINMFELGHAARGRLAHPSSWGSYFEHDPRVMAVSRHDVAGRATRPHSFKPVQLAIDAHIL
jgi:Thermostable hemolysin